MAHVEKRGAHRWRARYRAPNGQERSKTFARRIDAERFLAAAESAKLRGEWVAPERSRLTVGEWATEWIASYESLLRTRILPTWASVPLASITNAEVVAWVAELRSEGLSPSRTRQAYHVLSAMLDAAVRDRRLPSNPAAGVDLPRIPRKERRYLDHAQVEALADACGPYRPLVLTLAYCGLRWGEAAALRVRRVDLMRRRLEIAEAVTEVNGCLVFGLPKTHQTRHVPIPAFLRVSWPSTWRVAAGMRSSSAPQAAVPYASATSAAGGSTRRPERWASLAWCPTSCATPPRRLRARR